jgi:hypothetical protein
MSEDAPAITHHDLVLSRARWARITIDTYSFGKLTFYVRMPLVLTATHRHVYRYGGNDFLLPIQAWECMDQQPCSVLLYLLHGCGHHCMVLYYRTSDRSRCDRVPRPAVLEPNWPCGLMRRDQHVGLDFIALDDDN